MTETQQQQAEPNNLIFLEKGVIEDHKGRVAGFWIHKRKGNGKEVHLFEKPIKKVKPYRVEYKTIMVDGKPVENVPVKVYPMMSSFTHWGKYRA